MSKIDDILSKCDAWDESKHPRDKTGQFGTGGRGTTHTVRKGSHEWRDVLIPEKGPRGKEEEKKEPTMYASTKEAAARATLKRLQSEGKQATLHVGKGTGPGGANEYIVKVTPERKPVEHWRDKFK